VAVPQADMEEILPAARLLSRATAVTPSDYDRAKTLFLAGLHDAGMQAQVGAALPHTHLNTAPFVICHMQAQACAALPHTRLDTALFVICHKHAQTQMILVVCCIHVLTETCLWFATCTVRQMLSCELPHTCSNRHSHLGDISNTCSVTHDMQTELTLLPQALTIN